MKRFYFLSAFPGIVNSIVSESILARAEKKKIVKYFTKNLFDFSDPPHNRIDDYPFGGGSGMILKPEPVFKAFDEVQSEILDESSQRIIFPTPDGRLFNHEIAEDLANSEVLIFINGHYKGIDQRIRDELVTDEISIGDYVLTGGELPSMVILDAIVRLIPGVLNNYESAELDSFNYPLLDCPHYTRPEFYRGVKTPPILLSGNHKIIEDWKISKREEKTKTRRPDLWDKYKQKENGK